MSSSKLLEEIPQIISVIRRDLLSHECLICEAGTYHESAYDDHVRCSDCGDIALRWMSKKEMARHQVLLEGN